MYKIMLIAFLLCLLSNCSPDEIAEIENLQIYSGEHFKRYDSYALNSSDSEIQDDGSIIVVGVGSEDNFLTKHPFILKLDQENEIVDFSFVELDNKNTFRPIEIHPTNDGKYIYLSGSTEDEFSSDFDMDIRKISEEGDSEWVNRIGQPTINERGRSVVQLSDNDFIIASTKHIGFGSAESYLLTRVNDNGDLVWSKSSDEVNLFIATKILFLPADNTILVLTEHGISVNGSIKLTKLDLDGNIISSKLIAQNDDIWPISSSMKLLEDDSILVYYSREEPGSQNDFEILVKTFDANLTEILNFSFNEIESDIISDIIITSDGNLMLLSKSASIRNDQFDVILTKSTFSGEILWRKVYGTDSSDQGNTILERPNGNFIIIGNTNHNTSSEANFNLYLLETDAEGEPTS